MYIDIALNLPYHRDILLNTEILKILNQIASLIPDQRTGLFWF